MNIVLENHNNKGFCIKIQSKDGSYKLKNIWDLSITTSALISVHYNAAPTIQITSRFLVWKTNGRKPFNNIHLY